MEESFHTLPLQSLECVAPPFVLPCTDLNVHCGQPCVYPNLVSIHGMIYNLLAVRSAVSSTGASTFLPVDKPTFSLAIVLCHGV